MNIIKRNGEVVPFYQKKIYNAIFRAATSVKEMSADNVQLVTDNVTETLMTDFEDEYVSVEKIQDIVEDALMDQGFKKTAKAYILYRQKHAEQREASLDLMKQYNDLLFSDSEDVDLKRDNANINCDAPMGIMLKLGAEGAKTYADHFVHPEEFAKADKENYLHIHDKDFSLITFNCCQIDLSKLLKDGFSTGHGFLREPNSIRAAASLACIAIQSNQNDMFGGQSINALDYALAPYVDKSFKKALERILLRVEDWLGHDLYHLLPDNIKEECIKNFIRDNNIHYGLKGKELTDAIEKIETELFGKGKRIYHGAAKVYKMACKDVEDETKQAMEALIHNFNTLHSRAGKMTA